MHNWANLIKHTVSSKQQISYKNNCTIIEEKDVDMVRKIFVPTTTFKENDSAGFGVANITLNATRGIEL